MSSSGKVSRPDLIWALMGPVGKVAGRWTLLSFLCMALTGGVLTAAWVSAPRLLGFIVVAVGGISIFHVLMMASERISPERAAVLMRWFRALLVSLVGMWQGSMLVDATSLGVSSVSSGVIGTVSFIWFVNTLLVEAEWKSSEPFLWASRFLGVILPRSTFEADLAPLIADLQEAYYLAAESSKGQKVLAVELWGMMQIAWHAARALGFDLWSLFARLTVGGDFD